MPANPDRAAKPDVVTAVPQIGRQLDAKQ